MRLSIILAIVEAGSRFTRLSSVTRPAALRKSRVSRVQQRQSLAQRDRRKPLIHRRDWGPFGDQAAEAAAGAERAERTRTAGGIDAGQRLSGSSLRTERHRRRSVAFSFFGRYVARPDQQEKERPAIADRINRTPAQSTSSLPVFPTIRRPGKVLRHRGQRQPAPGRV